MLEGDVDEADFKETELEARPVLDAETGPECEALAADEPARDEEALLA